MTNCLNSIIIKKLKENSNNETKEDRCSTKYPLYVVQALECVAAVDEDYYDEEESDDTIIRYKYLTNDGSIDAELAREKIKEALEEDEPVEVLIEAIKEYPDYKTESHDLAQVWESMTGFGSKLVMYKYTDKIWFITRQNAEEYIKEYSYKYRGKKPRVFVKSLIDTDFTELLRELGFKNYE